MIPQDALSQIGDLPVIVAILLITMAAVVGTVFLVMRLLSQTEMSRREERQTRDGTFLGFFQQQRDLDRELGRQTAESFARALSGLADSIRDNGTATLAVMNEIRGRVDDALNVHTDAIRATNYMLSKVGHDIDALRAERSQEDHERANADHAESDRQAKKP